MKKILKNELLFHSTHGLCRVAAIMRTSSPAETSYSLLPISQSRSKTRFTVSGDSLAEAGFNRLVSEKDALSILEYFKTGDKKASAEGNAWTLAVTLRTESRSKEILKDKRKGQKLNHLVRSLAGELAIALQVTVAETLEKIQKSLAPISKINPLILTALTSPETLMA